MGTICEFDLCLRRHYQPEMKFNKLVSSSRRKQHKRYHNAPSHIRRKMMSFRLSVDITKETTLERSLKCTEKSTCYTLTEFKKKRLTVPKFTLEFIHQTLSS